MVPRVVDTAFLQHPPNPLQHSLSAFWQNRPERRKVGDTLTATVAPAGAKVTYQWLSNGEDIIGATSSTLSVTDNLFGKRISVEVTDEDGNTAVSDETKPVQKDNAVTVTVTDIDGLQADGTGLVGDRLRLSYGSSLGVPQIITWYYNDLVVATATDKAQSVDGVLQLATGGNTIRKDGEYYVVITNSDGDTYTSNTVTLVYDELPAEIASIDIEDDYEGDMNITYKAKDNQAVITVNMEKYYEGKFYVYEDGVVNYNTNNYTTMLEAGDDTFLNVTNFEKMTAKNVLDGTFKGLDNYGYEDTNDNLALKYVAPNGETTLMWAVRDTEENNKGFLTRGKSYKIVFDQEDITEDNIDAASRKDVETTESVEAPYVEAPAAIVLETAANGQKAVVNFVDEDGDKLTWLGAANSNWSGVYDDNTTGFDYISVYGNSEAKTDGAERAATGGTFVKGVWTSNNAVDKNTTLYYAEAKTLAGVFGEESEKLQSNYKTKNLTLASKLKVSDDGTTAKLEMADVIAPATVYVYNLEEAAEAGGFDPDDSSSYRGSAEVAVGQGSATVSSVFKKDEIGKKYAAVLVPNDEAAYARYSSESMTLKNKPTTLEYAPGATLTDAAGLDKTNNTLGTVYDDTFTSTTLIVKNQFGDVIENGTNLSSITDKAATVAVSNSGKKYTEKGGATFSYNGTTLTIKLGSDTIVDSGDGFDVTLLGTTIKFRAAYTTETANDKPFNAAIGSDAIMKEAEAQALDNATKINNALTNRDTVTADPANIDDTVTVPKNKTLTLDTSNTLNEKIVNNGTLDLGTVTTASEIENLGTIKLSAGNLALAKYTAPADSTSVVTGNHDLTIGTSLTIGSGATMTVAKDLILDTTATVRHDGEKLEVTAHLTTNTTAQNNALATEIDITGVDGTAAAPTAITAGALKTICGSGSTIKDYGPVTTHNQAPAVADGHTISFYTFTWPDGQTTTSKWGVGYGTDVTTVNKTFPAANDVHTQLIGQNAEYTMHYAYDEAGDGKNVVYFNITFPATK